MDKASLVRIIILIATMVNAALTLLGAPPLPIGENEATVIAFILLGAVSSWTTLKHNFIGKKGKDQKETLEKNNLK